MLSVYSNIDKPHRITRQCRSTSSRSSSRGEVQQVQKELLPCPSRPICHFIQEFTLWIWLNLGGIG